ncbi:MAG: caspase family protein [Planctomycetes bacterium]|nr:caspase family protein [Planctomycetota bacterium]
MLQQLSLKVLVAALMASSAIGCQGSDNTGATSAPPRIPLAPSLVESEVVEETPAEERAEPGETADPDHPRHALLIGCSRYDHLPKSAELRGPVNDVVMMKELLTQRFQFVPGNVITLAEAGRRNELRPLRANIEREMKRLAEIARPGSQVVVYFSGHGAQQPNDNPDDPDDAEPDGLDELLLPADIKPDKDSDSPTVPNAITDDELRVWLNAIQKKGASIWAIIDACHSGTAIRGTEVKRQVATEMLISRKALEKAKPVHRATRGVSADGSAFDFDEHAGGIVAIYAAQPHEPTIELPLPIDAENGEWRGLLTYNLVKVLTSSKTPITYTELVQRIHQEYVTTLGRLGPVPLVEGNDRNREVLGTTEWPERSRLILQVEKPGRLKVNAGRLHGLTPQTILAVFPPAGKESSGPLGYVTVKRSGMTDATVVPATFDDKEPPSEGFANGCRCEIARREYGDMRLRVAIDVPKSEESTQSTWRQQLTERASRDGSVFELVDDPARAQWLVRTINQNEVVLLPAEGWVQSPGDDKTPTFGPAPIDDMLDDWLTDRLSKIARASSLLKISGEMTGERQRGLLSSLFGKDSTDLRVELRDLKSEDDVEGKPMEWQRGGLSLEDGSIIALRIHNASKHAVDFTVLFVDSSFGIDAVFPDSQTVVDNRLAPGASFTVGPLAIDATSTGLEHLVVIGVKAEGTPVDFSWLSQPALEQARAVDLGLETANPLGKLFQHALFGSGQTRGLKAANTGSVAVQAISWQSLPRTKP